MERVKGTNLEKKVRFEVRDYRNIDEQFDRIVSVGMFEHVGISYYKTFFHKVKNILVDDGVMLLHTIARTGNPMPTHPFIRKYIFPGGYIPSISEVSCAIEQSGLIVNDMEILRLHYANTLEHWRKRFAANREKVKNIYNESFCRMWELYLASSEAGFRWHDFVVLQVQLTKRNDILPITRDYIYKRKK